MPKVKDFLNNPQILHKLLSIKYFFSPEDYNVLQIDRILFGKHSKCKALYTECLMKTNQSECLKRIYCSTEIKARIPKLSEFYIIYQSFFCNPFFTNSHFTHLLCKHYEAKAELFYMKNYHNDNDDIASFERNVYRDESSSSENVTIINIIFDEKLRKKIDKITENKEILNTLSLDDNYLNSLSSNANELYTKRSNNDSLRNILFSFSKINYPNKNFIKNPHKQIRKYAMIKERDIIIKPTKPIHRSYLNKQCSNQSDSLKSMSSLLEIHKPSTKLQFKKPCIVSSSRNSSKNISMFRKINNNKTFEIMSWNNNNKNIKSNINMTNNNNLNLFKNNNLLSTQYFNRQTRSNNNNSTHSIFHQSNQKSMSSSQSKAKNPSQKVFLSHCSSLTLMKTKPKCSLVKQTNFLMPLSLHDNNDNLSRNKKKEVSIQSVAYKNNPIVQLTRLSKMNINPHKITKSLDTKDNRIALPLNQKTNFRDFSKGKRQSLPLSYKLAKQINDLMKYAKSSKSPTYKKYY